MVSAPLLPESIALADDGPPRKLGPSQDARLKERDRLRIGYHPGLLSGLVLAGANIRPTELGRDDGILTALEVAELDLSGVELAVLSACETGLGRVAGGEGLLGLQRAFQVAGARAVVASLWKVGDEATQILMAEFYKNLWERKLPKAEALRQAQLTLLREYKPNLTASRGPLRKKVDSQAKKSPAGKRMDDPRTARAIGDERLEPFYWAAFVLSGDWR
jgi:CHAT domain-containing protein